MKGTKIKKIILIITLIVLGVFSTKVLVNAAVETEKMPTVKYQTHIQDVGWQDYKSNGQMSGTEGQSKRLEGIKIQAENLKIKYQVHIQDIGWQEWKKDGQMAGTEGQSKRLEGIKISLENTDDYSIMYRVHVQDVGWQEWKKDGQMAGTEGQSKRLEAIEVKIVDGPKKARIFVESGTSKKVYKKNDKSITLNGWKMADFENNILAVYLDGKRVDDKNVTQSKREDVIKAITGYGTEKENPTPGFSINLDLANIKDGEHTIQINVETAQKEVVQTYWYKFSVQKEIHVNYQTHVQGIGWQNYAQDGEMAGTEGQSLRLEAIKIELKNAPEGAKIKYKTHVENVGWQDWKYAGELSGTEGKCLRLEGIKIELENMPGYSIQYRTHVQDVGWQEWANDGEMSGTEGQSKRLESIQIKIVPKVGSKIRMTVDTLVPSKIGQEPYKINGWLMTDIEDVKLQLLVNDKIAEAEITRHKRPDVINAVKGYGGETLNPNPGFEIAVDLSKYELGKINLKVQAVNIEGKVLLEKEINSEICPKIERVEGTYGKSGLKIAGNGGSDLPYLKYGNGENVFFATFAIHGYEDLWEKDGQELVDIANKFYNKLISDKDYELAEKWTIYVFPGVNQDGLKSGWTHNGPGRTSLYSAAPGNQGIDMNRCWQVGDTYQKYTSARNYNGTTGFQAYEAQALRDFMLENKSEKGQTVVIDLHGWTQQLIGDPDICSHFEKQFPENDKSGVGRYGTGYMVNWARTYLGSSAGAAKAALIELPEDGVTGHQAVINKKFADRYITATIQMLKSIKCATGGQEVALYSLRENTILRKSNIKTTKNKSSEKYKVAFSGMLENKAPEMSKLDNILQEKHPKYAGIWIYEKDRDGILEMLKQITKSEYKIDENGYLKIVSSKNQNENDKKLENAIKGEKLYIIRNSSLCYIVDEITGEVLDCNFEKLDRYQTYEYFQDADKMIIFMNENTKRQMTSKEIMQSVIDLM